MVGFEVDQAMRLAHARLALLAQFAFQRLDEGREHVQHQRTALGDQGAQGRVHAGTHHDRAGAQPFAGATDAVRGIPGLLFVIHEGQPVGLEPHSRELGQQAVADGLGRDTGAIGYVEDRTQLRHRHLSPASP